MSFSDPQAKQKVQRHNSYGATVRLLFVAGVAQLKNCTFKLRSLAPFVSATLFPSTNN